MNKLNYLSLFIISTSLSLTSCGVKTDKRAQSDSLEASGSMSGNTDSSFNDSANVNAGAEKNRNPKDWLLSPGISAGVTKLNSDAAELVRRLGKPDGGDAAMGKSVAIWYSNHDTTAHSTAVFMTKSMGGDDLSTIKQIRVTSPVFKTKEGIHPSSSLSEISKCFTIKKTETYKDAGVSYSIYDSDQGIAFEIGPDSKCAAIIIHEAGVTSPTTYAKFRTTNKFYGSSNK